MKIIKGILKTIFTFLTVIILLVATLLCFSIQWMFDTWNNLSMEELVYHLTAPLDGTNEDMIKEYLNVCAAPTILIILLIIILLIALKGGKKYYLTACLCLVLSVSLAGGTLYNAWNRLDVNEYVEAQSEASDFIERNYVDPKDVNITFPEQKRNLIYIFLESMETTYADKENGGAFEENVIPGLTKLAQENEDFSGIDGKLNGGYVMPYTGWTMAAMFAHTSGLPLNISIDGNSMDTQESFFPGITTLGDILSDVGYSQTLLIGSDATFGGRRLYFTEHGNYDILDYNYAIETGKLPEDYKVWWGYEDQKMFDYAKERLLELSSQDNPFNLTMLTVDTHFEDGYICEICSNEFGEDQYSNVMACSSRQLEEFISWIQQQDFYEDTTIILTGDHLTMDSDYCTSIDENGEYERKVYTCYINSAASPEQNERREYTTLDTFPTTLAALGVEIEGNKLGLGTNLFSAEQTILEKMGKETLYAELYKKSEFTEKLAEIDKDEYLASLIGVSIDSYNYKAGVLPVTVWGIDNFDGNVTSVMLAVWTEEDQSDLQWVQTEKQTEGSYFVNINVPNFNYKTGDYYVQAYVIDDTGEQYCVGEATGVVE